MSPDRKPVSIVQRLAVSHAVVITIMVVSIGLVAAWVGPPLLDIHMHQAGHGNQPAVLQHSQEAFKIASGIALIVGIIIAICGSIIASILLTRPLTRHLDSLAASADQMGQGICSQPVPLLGGSTELDNVTSALNSMSAQIAATEQTRRQMLMDLAHEMRTPLANLSVISESIRDGITPSDPDTLDLIDHEIARLTRLADDIAAVSKAEEGTQTLEVSQTDLHQLLAQAVQTTHARYSAAELKFVTDLPADPVYLKVDPTKITQICDNLLRNAAQHTPNGGTITARLSQTKDNVTITITDTGSGISPADLPRLFERFYRSDISRHRDGDTGTGVGLSIAKAIALAHGGHLTAASAGPDQGAQFTLTLPKATA